MANDYTTKRVERYKTMGLTVWEVAKLTDLSLSTVKRYLKELTPKGSAVNGKHAKAYDMSKRGYSYSYIARKFDVSKGTVYRWVKDLKNEDALKQP